MRCIGSILFCVLVVILETTSEFVDELEFSDRQPYFEKSSYKAKITEGVVEIIDGPIKLINCDLYNFDIGVTADETKYYPLVNPPPPSDLIKNCSVLFFANSRVEDADVLYDIIGMDAYVDNYYSVSRTNIVIINTSSYDPYKLVYNVNGTEYVILNYFYFKLFLLIIVATGILILIFEIREIVLKYKDKKYVHLDELMHI